MSKKVVCNLVVGGFYSALYPKHNFKGLTADLEFRRFKVLAIRDTKIQPVEKEWVRQRPTLCRGRWLVVVEDLDRGEQRQFYWESMKAVQPLEMPAESPRFMVLSFDRVTYETDDLGRAIAFKDGAKAGDVYGRMTG